MTNRAQELEYEIVAGRRTRGTWGGYRPGAGRKGFLRDKHRLTVDFDGEDFERLTEIAEEREASAAQVVRIAVRAYLKRLRRK